MKPGRFQAGVELAPPPPPRVDQVGVRCVGKRGLSRFEAKNIERVVLSKEVETQACSKVSTRGQRVKTLIGWSTCVSALPRCNGDGVSSEARFKLKAPLSFSQSKFETRCFQVRVELAPPYRGPQVATRALQEAHPQRIGWRPKAVTHKNLNSVSASRVTLELPIGFGNSLVKKTQKHHGLSIDVALPRSDWFKVSIS